MESRTVTIHDKRSCIATWLGKSGTRPDLIDRILNHVPRDGIRRHHNFFSMDCLVHEAMQRWPDHVPTITG